MQAAGDLPHYMARLGKGFLLPHLLHGHQQVRLSSPGPFPPTREGRMMKVWASLSSSHSTPSVGQVGGNFSVRLVHVLLGPPVVRQTQEIKKAIFKK